jgi:hypothetical protein
MADEQPPWSGKTVSHYEVLEKLGGGGMGVVYKARDLRLDRFAALKFLSPHLGDSAEARQRFIHEAKAASALDHPNIGAIYEIGETDDGHLFLCLAFYDGETLKSRLERGPLKIEEAIDYACQIAAGLARAHAQGIVHRDVKPANLLVSRGQVKIVDFGLAKLASQTRLTQAGHAMGTSGYMSPEQLRGQEVDRRTDVWALGVVLYEMITGRPPFQGDSPAAIGHALLFVDPEPMTALRTGVPLELDRIVFKALAKDPADRYQHVDEIPVDLRAVRRASGSAPGMTATTLAAPVPLMPGVPPAAATSAPPRPRHRWRTAVLLAVVFLAVAGATAWTERLLARRSPPPLTTFRSFSVGSSGVTRARFTPDGKSFVYDASAGTDPTRIFLARSEDLSSPIVLQPGALASVSSKGEMAILLQDNPNLPNGLPGTLARVPLLGGGPRKLLRDVVAADWAPDGSGLAVLRWSGGGSSLEFPIGSVLSKMTGAGELRFSPDGKRIAFLDRPVQGDTRGSVAIVDLEGKKRILSDGWWAITGLAWAPGGEEIWFTASKDDNWTYGLHAVDLQGRVRTLFNVPSDLEILDISRTGEALVQRTEWNLEAFTWSAGQAGMREIGWIGSSFPVDISPDGRTVLLSYQGVGSGANYSVHLRPIDGSPAVNLGEGAAQGFSPDGKWVAALLYGPPARLVLYATDLGGETKSLPLPFPVSYARWFPDGRRFALTGEEPGGTSRCYELSVTGGRPKPIGPQGVGCGVLAQSPVSPDGKWLVVTTGPEALLSPLAGGPFRKLPAYWPWELFVRWHSNGREVFLVNTKPPWKIILGDVTTGERRLWKDLAIPERLGVVFPSTSVLSPDGTSGIQSFNRIHSVLYLVNGLR